MFSSLIFMFKSYPRALYRRRRLPNCLRCDFHSVFKRSFSETLTVFFMAAPHFFLSSILLLIRSRLCTSVLLLLLIAYVWLLLGLTMVVVRHSHATRKTPFTYSRYSQGNQVRCIPSACRRFRPSRVRLCLHQSCASRLFKQ